MNQTVFAENMKKFRQAKKYTQEQVAEKLCVNSQTVSRWECGATLPDVLMLPEIAELYGVLVDDFFKKQSIAYENYAERLAAAYEFSDDPEDFFRCRMEYEKMLKDGELSINGKWIYATVYAQMMDFCQKEALKWYDAVLENDEDKDLHPYRRAASMKMGLLFSIGKGAEVIKEQEAKFEAAKESLELREWVLLMDAYAFSKQYEKVYEVYRRAIEIYPDNWELYVSGGYACGELGRYDEAFACFEKAEEIGTPFCDGKNSMAHYYEKQGEYQKAYDTYMEIDAIYRQRGLEFEADIALRAAKEMKEKVAK